jgi:orotidine-5'-phosphate decarboxylase
MSRLCVALDVEKERALELVRLLSDLDVVFKVGPKLFLQGGKDLIGELRLYGDIFLDLKLHDIPNTVRLAVEEVSTMGVRYLTLHTLGGERMLREAVSVKGGVKLIGVTVLTSHGEDYLQFLKSGFKSIRDFSLYLSEVAEECGLDGVVCSGAEVEEIKRRTGLYAVVPGVRLSKNKDDQVRVFSPEEVAVKGADLIVMGRDIYMSEDPRRTASEVLERISAQKGS